MENNLIEVQLSVEEKMDKIIAHLFFKNKSEKEVYLDKQTIYYNGIVRNNYFEIINKDDVEVDYTGRMINCTLLPEDFIELAAGEEISSSVQLSDFYKMDKGDKYIIQYYAFNPSFLKDHQLMKMESNKVEISY